MQAEQATPVEGAPQPEGTVAEGELAAPAEGAPPAAPSDPGNYYNL